MDTRIKELRDTRYTESTIGRWDDRSQFDFLTWAPSSAYHLDKSLDSFCERSRRDRFKNNK